MEVFVGYHADLAVGVVGIGDGLWDGVVVLWQAITVILLMPLVVLLVFYLSLLLNCCKLSLAKCLLLLIQYWAVAIGRPLYVKLVDIVLGLNGSSRYILSYPVRRTSGLLACKGNLVGRLTGADSTGWRLRANFS